MAIAEWGFPRASDSAGAYGSAVPVTTVSSSFIVPQGATGAQQVGNVLTQPSQMDQGMFFLTVDGATVGLAFSSQTFANSLVKIAVGAYLAKPIWLPPGATYFVITSAGTATLNLIRAVRIG